MIVEGTLEIHSTVLPYSFMQYVSIQENECWLWTGGKDPDGYGIYSHEGKSRRAHRWAWQFVTSITLTPDIPLDHYWCDTPSCVNPDHVTPCTPQQNVLRSTKAPAGINARKTHCSKGHPFSGENLRIKANGQRACRICDRRMALDYYYRKQAEKCQ